jgi:hypothetical protein
MQQLSKPGAMPTQPILQFKFSRALRVAQREWREAIEDGPIVYRMRVSRKDGGGPQPINRAGGVDPDGIWDIGESKHGHRRLEDFARVAIEEKRASHRGGSEYSDEWGYSFASQFPRAQLRVDVLR